MITKASNPWFSEYMGQWIVYVAYGWSPEMPMGVVHATHMFNTEVEAQELVAKIRMKRNDQKSI